MHIQAEGVMADAKFTIGRHGTRKAHHPFQLKNPTDMIHIGQPFGKSLQPTATPPTT